MPSKAISHQKQPTRRLMGRALGALGRHEEALDALRQAVVEQEEVGNEPFAASALAWVAEELVAVGDIEAALPLADEALTRLLATRGWGVDDPVGALASCAGCFDWGTRLEHPMRSASESDHRGTCRHDRRPR